MKENMVGSPDSSNQNLVVFNKGQGVEVSSDEEGFRGSWYVATILELPTPTPTPTSPTAAAAKTGGAKKRRKALVEYKTLVTEDGSAALTELVDPSLIRPLPPQDLGTNKRVFQETEAVDARFRDGWWSGVVTKVLEGGLRYKVYFDNPPDVIDFDATDLRVHLDWVNGKWVQPEMQQTTGSFFSSGTAVEVNLDNDSAWDVWLPAVVIKENGDNTFLVKYEGAKKSDEAGITKVVVDSLHIRPVPPPHHPNRNYLLLEKVDTRYGFGWRSGVITKLLAGRRYNVFCKRGNEDKEFDHSEIRPLLEWVDGKWISKSNLKENVIVSDGQEQFSNANNNDNSKVAEPLESSDPAEEKSIEKPVFTSIRNLAGQSSHSDEKPLSHGLSPSLKKIKVTISNGSGMRSCSPKKLAVEDIIESALVVTPLQSRKIRIDMSNEEMLHGLATPKTGSKRTRYSNKRFPDSQPAATAENAGKTVKTKQLKLFELDCQKVDIITKKGRPTKSPFRSSQASAAVKDGNAVVAADKGISERENKMKEFNVSLILGLKATDGTRQDDKETLKLMRNQKKQLNDSMKDKDMELNQQEQGGGSQRRKRGRPRKFPLASEAGKDNPGSGDTTTTLKDRVTTAVELPTEAGVEPKVSQNSVRERTSEVSMTDFMSREVNTVVAGASKNVVDDDQPLSTWFGGMQSSTSVEELKLTSGRAANVGAQTRERQVIVVESSAINATGNGMPMTNQCIPFVKRSPVWKTIESMEVFQIIPQKPHFRPLAESKEEYREGSAIGIMVTFASLFEKISSLQFDDCSSIYESILESLLDLEKHGFDVTVPCSRVNELLSIKDAQAKTQNELKDVETKMRVHTDEKRKLEGKMKDVERKIRELQEELALTKAKIEVKERDISRVQSHVDAMNERIKNARGSFGKVAASPWKLP